VKRTQLQFTAIAPHSNAEPNRHQTPRNLTRWQEKMQQIPHYCDIDAPTASIIADLCRKKSIDPKFSPFHSGS